MTESPATVTPIVRPLSHERVLHSPTNFTLSLGPRAPLCGGRQAHSLRPSEKSSCFYNAVAALYVAEWWMKGKRQSWGAAEARTRTHTHPTTPRQWLRRVRSLHGSALCARLSLWHALPLSRLDSWRFTHSQRLWQHAEDTRWGWGPTRPTSPHAGPGEWKVAAAVPSRPVASLSSGQSSSFPPPP